MRFDLLVALFAAFCACVPAGAVPVSGYDIRAEMRATVTSVTGGGEIVDPGGNPIRSFDAGELGRTAWNVGDELRIAWQIGPEQMIDCWDGGSFYSFGGISSGGMGTCSPSLPAATASLVRSDGTSTTDLYDGFESAFGIGPSVDLATGQFFLGYSTVDGLVVGDCCAYTYDPVLDEILSGPSAGISFAAPAFLFGEFGATSGGGTYVFALLDAALGDIWSANAALDIAFDVEWVTHFSRVPEPAAFGLFAVAFGLIARRRRRAS